MDTARPEEVDVPHDPLDVVEHVLVAENLPFDRTDEGDRAWRVRGEKPERWIRQTDFGNEEAVGFLADAWSVFTNLLTHTWHNTIGFIKKAEQAIINILLSIVLRGEVGGTLVRLGVRDVAPDVGGGDVGGQGPAGLGRQAQRLGGLPADLRPVGGARPAAQSCQWNWATARIAAAQ